MVTTGDFRTRVDAFLDASGVMVDYISLGIINGILLQAVFGNGARKKIFISRIHRCNFPTRFVLWRGR